VRANEQIIVVTVVIVGVVVIVVVTIACDLARDDRTNEHGQ